MQIHARVHTAEKLFEYDKCPAKFKTKANLHSDNKNKHEMERHHVD